MVRPLRLDARAPRALILWLLLAACSGSPRPVSVQAADARATLAPPTRLASDVARLAAPDFEGRGAGTAGADSAAEWVAARFEALGLEPAGESGGYFQEFTIPAARRLGSAVTVEIVHGDRRTPVSSAEFEATLASAPGACEGVLVDVGEGMRYDDEAWKSAEPKIALATWPAAKGGAAASEPAPSTSNPHGAGFGDLRTIAFNARQHKAVGLVVLASDLAAVEHTDGESADVGLPVLLATPHAAEGLIAHVAELARAGSPSPPLRLRFDPGVVAVERRTRNVLAKLPASRSGAQVLVLGAHYDHLGYGGSDSRAPGERAIHPGADDNASGTALLLEVARRLAALERPLSREIVFAAWGAEEKGLLGSAHWTKRPTVAWSRVAANLNFDMVGRSSDRHLDIGSVASATAFKDAIEAANASLQRPLNVRTSVKGRGVGGSDHMSFLAASRPALFFFTGLHTDYHKPSDTAEKIDAATMADIADLVVNLVEELDRAATLEFVKPPEPPPESSPASQGAERGLRASLGTIPDYGSDDGGVVLSGVGPGSAAETAGLRAKDVVVRLGPYKIDNIYDLTEALSRLKPGDEVDVEFVRDGAKQTAKATLKARR